MRTKHDAEQLAATLEKVNNGLHIEDLRLSVKVTENLGTENIPHYAVRVYGDERYGQGVPRLTELCGLIAQYNATRPAWEQVVAAALHNADRVYINII